jgi:GAF domain-containing protein
MIEHLLQRLTVSRRIIITYLFMVLCIGVMLGILYATYSFLIDEIRGIADSNLHQQILNIAKERLQILVAFSLILLGWGFVLVLLVIRSITKQIDEARERVEKIRTGRLNVNQPVDQLDEFGVLSVSINHLAGQIAKDKENQVHTDEARLDILKEHALQLQVVSDITREAVASKDSAILVERCAHIIQERFSFYHVGIYLLDDERRFLVLQAITGLTDVYNTQRGLKIRLGETNVVGNVVGSGEPRIINDVDMDYIFRKDPLLPETRAEAVFPLKAGQEVIGVLEVHCRRKNVFGESLITILRILANELSIAIQNDRLERQLERSIYEANSLYQRYTQEIWSRQAMGKSFSGYEYNLLEVTPITGEIKPQFQLTSEYVERLKNGRAIRIKSGLLVNSKELERELTNPDHSVLLVPMVLYNQLMGVIGLEEDEQDHEWTEDEITIIEAVTTQLALSLENARLLEESQIRSGQLRLLQEVTAVAASHTNLYELLDNVSQKLRASFNLLHCGMFLLEPDGQVLSMVANASAEPFVPGAKLIGTRILLGNISIIEQVIKERNSIVIYDVQKKAIEENDPLLLPWRDFVQTRGANTIIFVPLFLRSEIMGVVTLELADASRHFSESDLKLMDQISLQISSAIDVARSFEQTALRADRERKLGEITSRIRESLDIQTILKTAALEVRQVLDVPEVTVRLASSSDENNMVKGNPVESMGEDARR